MTRRRSPLPPNWPTLRQYVLSRDSWTCQLRIKCGGAKAGEVHHTGRHDDHSPSTLIAACKACHAAVTAKDANAARRAKYQRNRKPEPHPGRLAG